MSEIVTTDERQQHINPFLKESSEHLAVGSVAIESERAIAEVQAKLVLAKRFPRNLALAYDKLMEQCRRKDFAETAIYRYPRGGQNVEGASVRLAEEIARSMGNIEYGLRELANKPGESEMEAFAWDQESNVTSSQRFVVKHRRDKSDKATKVRIKEDLIDERDIYEVTANMGARRMRARILAIVPPQFEKDAVQECRRTIAAGGGKSLIDRRNDMVQAFKKLSVTVAMLEQYKDKKVDDFAEDDLVDLIGVYQAIKSGEFSKKDYFDKKDTPQASDLNQVLDADDTAPDGQK